MIDVSLKLKGIVYPVSEGSIQGICVAETVVRAVIMYIDRVYSNSCPCYFLLSISSYLNVPESFRLTLHSPDKQTGFYSVYLCFDVCSVIARRSGFTIFISGKLQRQESLAVQTVFG